MAVARRHIKVAEPIPMDGVAFRRLCTEHDTNITRLADDLGLNRNSIGRWLRGSAAPLLPAAYALADALKTDVTTLWPPRSSR